MPSLAELKRRFSTSSDVELLNTVSGDRVLDWDGDEETLVADNRGGLSPTQCVDQKLRDALSCGLSSITPDAAFPRRKPR